MKKRHISHIPPREIPVKFDFSFSSASLMILNSRFLLGQSEEDHFGLEMSCQHVQISPKPVTRELVNDASLILLPYMVKVILT